MKTEQEQIEEIVKILLESSKKCLDTDCNNCDYQYEKDCNQYRKALALVKSGYGDVTEYKAEIERLKAKNKSQERENDFLKYCQCLTHGVDGSSHIKKAQIDVLNELKTRHDYAIKNMGYPWDITQQIDELIKEVEDETV